MLCIIHFIIIQTYTRLSRLGVCLSHHQTQIIIDDLAASHDEEVRAWKDTMETTTDPHDIVTGDSLWGVIHDHLSLSSKH